MASRLTFCLLVCLTIRLAAQQPADAAAQVRKLEEKWTEAYKERDLDVLSTLLTEDFVITVEDGSTYSKAGYITHSADPRFTWKSPNCRTSMCGFAAAATSPW